MHDFERCPDGEPVVIEGTPERHPLGWPMMQVVDQDPDDINPRIHDRGPLKIEMQGMQAVRQCNRANEKAAC